MSHCNSISNNRLRNAKFECQLWGDYNAKCSHDLPAPLWRQAQLFGWLQFASVTGECQSFDSWTTLFARPPPPLPPGFQKSLVAKAGFSYKHWSHISLYTTDTCLLVPLLPHAALFPCKTQWLLHSSNFFFIQDQKIEAICSRYFICTSYLGWSINSQT